ncbi:peptidoglycan DD-metalloendopeptidase family protein [Gordonia sp. PKS22-38]|uniref:Peptidoglycan DD-metalloendopeptidase family protein n=1 Tax=Gordonia prachuapensis TaxID=3115651 RepID=A0ABU7MRH5_9ACTN|nr:peptidoglycan DD-metalloendopeptidase family protein [Gordonia sp. PKS22-38]
MTPPSPGLRGLHSRALRAALTVLAELLVVALLVWLIPALAWAETRRFVAPLDSGPTVVRTFDPPRQRWEPGHRGVDLATFPGAAVRAAGAGRVRFAGVLAGRPVVSIQHQGELITTYEPVRASVRQGQSVRRGEVIGVAVVGHPGCPVAACLHWGARRGSARSAVYLNPMGLLGAVRVRLKPVGDDLTLADGPAGGLRVTVPR